MIDREAMKMALEALEKLTDGRIFTADLAGYYGAAKNTLRQALAQPEQESKPMYVMGNYAGEGKVVSAFFGLPKGAFEFAPYTGSGEASKIKHSLEPQPEQEHIECGYDETVGMCTNNPCCEQAQPEQAVVPFPSFMRKRIEQAMKDAINPKGMSVHVGKAKVLVSDLHRMLLVIDSVLAQPDLSIEANRVAYDVAMHYANKTKEKNT